MSSNDRVKILYVAGSGRSGSTVVAQLLAAVPGWVTCGELRLGLPVLLQNRLCGCGARSQQCPFWRAVMQAAFGGFDMEVLRRTAELTQRVALNRHTMLHFLRLKDTRFAREVREYASIIERIYQGVRAVTGCDVIIDTSKLPAYFLALDTAQTLDMRTVHVVRDSRAVAFSNQRRIVDPANPDVTRYMPQQSLALTSIAWNLKNAFISGAMANHRRPIMVRYEDFVSSPLEQIERVLAFVGSDQAPPPIAGGQIEIGTHHTLAGNPMRFHRGAVRLRLDDEWHSKMKRQDRALVTALTWPMLARYGYLHHAGAAPGNPNPTLRAAEVHPIPASTKGPPPGASDQGEAAHGETRRKPRRRLIAQILKVAVAITLLAVLVFRIGWQDIVTSFTSLAWWWIPGLLTIRLSGLFLQSLRWKLFLSTQNIEAPTLRLFRQFWVSRFFNNFLPGQAGGDASRILYGWDKTVKKTGLTSSVIMDRAVGLLGLCLTAVVAGFARFDLVNQAGLAIWPWCAAAGAAGLLVLATTRAPTIWALRATRFLPSRSLRPVAAGVLRDLAVHTEHRGRLLAGIALSAAFYVVAALHAYLAFRAFGVEVEFAGILVIVPLTAAIMGVPISVNGWGVTELASVVLYAQLGVAAADALSVALLGRVTLTMIGGMGGLIFLWSSQGGSSWWRGRRSRPLRTAV